MSEQPIESAKDPDLRLSPQAMQRAALRAREIAAQTGTAIVISEQDVIHPKAEQMTPSVQQSKVPYGDKP